MRRKRRDLTAPGLLGYLLSPFWTVIIISAAAVALAKDLPAMLLAVSRLMFAWAGDGIFPRAIASVHPVFRTPHIAIIASAAMATVGILGSHLAGDFFLGVDILVSSMLVNIRVRRMVAALGVVVLAGFLAVHTWKDLTGPAAAWYFRSTPVWAVVMAIGSLVYWFEVAGLHRAGVDVRARLAALPPE
jgi:APA family basic amino acid/polyamine antiporter